MTVVDQLESFVGTVTDALSQTDAPHSAVNDVRDSGEELLSVVDELAHDAREKRERVETLEQTVDQLEGELSETRERVDELEADLADAREQSARELADVRSRVTAVEESVESGGESPDSVEEPDSPAPNPRGNGSEIGLHEPKTPLEEVTRLPEHLADGELTANQARARAVFRDVLDYTESVPKGRAIATPDLRRVLTALRDGGTACYKTVSRVVDFLTELGGDDVWTTERMNGDTVVVFSDEICRRRAAQLNATDGVVTAERVAD